MSVSVPESITHWGLRIKKAFTFSGKLADMSATNLSLISIETFIFGDEIRCLPLLGRLNSPRILNDSAKRIWKLFFLGFISESQLYDLSSIELLKRSQLPMVITSDNFLKPAVQDGLILQDGYSLETSIDVST